MLKLLCGACLLCASTFAVGCHDLMPHRLQRMNRGPDMTGADGYNFSVPDPIPPLQRDSEDDSTPPTE